VPQFNDGDVLLWNAVKGWMNATTPQAIHIDVFPTIPITPRGPKKQTPNSQTPNAGKAPKSAKSKPGVLTKDSPVLSRNATRQKTTVRPWTAFDDMLSLLNIKEYNQFDRKSFLRNYAPWCHPRDGQPIIQAGALVSPKVLAETGNPHLPLRCGLTMADGTEAWYGIFFLSACIY